MISTDTQFCHIDFFQEIKIGSTFIKLHRQKIYKTKTKQNPVNILLLSLLMALSFMVFKNLFRF